ncbi:MAG: Holliday junction resolvase RuvX [Thermoleophilia bacterium]
MARVLAIDYGTARTGLALSDPLGVTCRPLEILREKDRRRLLARIEDVVRREAVAEIVVGLPRPLAGGSNEQLRRVEQFAQELAESASVPVKTWDERFTSKLARAGMAESRPRGGRARGEAVDAVAACYLLQGYLDSRQPGSTG